jgi:hypothetical protein
MIKEIINEIGFTSELVSVKGKSFDLADASLLDNWETNDIWEISDSGKHFFFIKNDVGDNFDAYVAITPTQVIGRWPIARMENVSGKRGFISSILAYLVSVQKMKLVIPSDEGLTQFSLDWVIRITDNGPRGFAITDQNGDKIDTVKLRDEWRQAQRTGISGPTAILIENSHISTKLLTERNYTGMLMPMLQFSGDDDLL